MKLFADMHIHSKYSQATSHNLNIENLEKYAKIKGLHLLGTGDFTHPLWFKELKEKLTETENQILITENKFLFILQTEVSNIFSWNGKAKKVHNVILSPSFEVVEQINEFLGKKGNLEADGRPIFGMSCAELVEGLKEILDKIEIFPAHAWTPWFSVFGSMSGFDSMEECYQEHAKNIYALETGLSSDPEMNWRLSKLDRFTILSNSDSHSFWPWRIGRECNIFDLRELSYDSLIKAIRTRKGFVGTVEVDPAYGKYHFDGHRACEVCLSPQQSKKLGERCPKCRRKLTIGVLNRVEELADRAEGFKPEGAQMFYTLLPLSEIISVALGVKQLYSRKIAEIYEHLISKFGTEFNVLLGAEKEELLKIVPKKIAELILKNRKGKIPVKPGYDGVYGEIDLEESLEKETEESEEQRTLSEY